MHTQYFMTLIVQLIELVINYTFYSSMFIAE